MNSPASDGPRLASRRAFPNYCDPVYLLLDIIVFERLFRPLKRSVPGEFEQLTAADTEFLVENLNKHRLVLWLNVLLAGYLIAYGLDAILKLGDPSVVVTGLLAPAMITGGAWYAVSFGGIPEKFLSTALVLTACMYTAFTLSMTLLIALMCKLTPWPIGVFFLLPTYVGLYVASILYDNLDGLKIGLDTALLKFSRATLNYYQKHGYVTRRETESDVFDDPSQATSNQIALFTHYMNRLRENLAKLDAKQDLPVANRLIATSTGILFKVVDLTLESGTSMERGEGFADYVQNASHLGQETIDTATIQYLRLAIGALKTTMGAAPARELEEAEATLKQFSAEHVKTDDEAAQRMADHLFSEVFKQLLSLMSAHRDLFLHVHARSS